MTTEELVKRLSKLMEERPETRTLEVATEFQEEWPLGSYIRYFEAICLSPDNLVVLS